ncbi:cytochrome P450 [Fluviibacterium sp. S390]|uniref:cytochrome P450 n=1 Tax=Fluviibacterium sp. S390 TaxID=3415139 RepID=UPI003C7CDD95
MRSFSQSPRDPDFVQNPYAFYDRARATGPAIWWEDYKMPALLSHESVMAALKHPDLARVPPDGLPGFAPHLDDFAAVERHSLLSLEGPAHARLRKLVLRAFTTGRIRGMAPEITTLCHDLIDRFPDQPFDLMAAYCSQVPVIVIARLLGVDPAHRGQLLDWSHAMVAMYQARVDRAAEDAANTATAEFSAWLQQVLAEKSAQPDGGLLSALCAAQDADHLSADEIVALSILLLNAGHEATVSALGNAVTTLLATGQPDVWTRPETSEGMVEECLRIDPPLHIFTRYALRPVEIGGATLAPGDEVACVLGAANRDPAAYDAPAKFRPGRKGPLLTSFGAGVHFCLGAPLARLEMRIALEVLFDRCPGLTLTAPPHYADSYHFHGYPSLLVSV